MLDWNDLRYFLSRRRPGQHAGGRPGPAGQPDHCRPAHRRAGGSAGHAAVRKAPGRLRADAGGEELLGRAPAGRDGRQRFRRGVGGTGARHSAGSVRITTQEIFANTLLAPMLRELHDRHPEIVIELDTQQELLELGEGQADIAMRSTARSRPPARSVGASASTIGRSTAAANMPRAMASRATARS